MPFLISDTVADAFDALRRDVVALAGFDFLAVLGDMMRPASFVKNNPGSVTRSLHKCGVAFDYNQGEKNLVLVAEPQNGRMYWRTYLKCVKHDGSQGEALRIQNQQFCPGLLPPSITISPRRRKPWAGIASRRIRAGNQAGTRGSSGIIRT